MAPREDRAGSRRSSLESAAKVGVGQAAAELVEIVLIVAGFPVPQGDRHGRRGRLTRRAAPAGRHLHARRCAARRAGLEVVGGGRALRDRAMRPRARSRPCSQRPAARAKLKRFFTAWLEIKDAGRVHHLAEVVSRVRRRSSPTPCSARRNASCTAAAGEAAAEPEGHHAGQGVVRLQDLETIYKSTAAMRPEPSRRRRCDAAARHLLAAGRDRLALGADRHAADQARRLLGAQGDVHGDGAAAAGPRHQPLCAARDQDRAPAHRGDDGEEGLHRLPQGDRSARLLPGELRRDRPLADAGERRSGRRQHRRSISSTRGR